jgi:hypothetical protein
MQWPLYLFFLHPKQEMHPVYFSKRNKLNFCTSAPADSAPFIASSIKVSVFHPFLGPALTAIIYLAILSPFKICKKNHHILKKVHYMN